MSEKSHVSLEQHVCIVCGTTFDTGAILLDRRLQACMERHTVTDWGLCAEHQQLSVAGYVALVEVDPQRSGTASRLRPEQVYRTGRLAHLKREAFGKLLNVKLKESQPLVFVEPAVIDRLLAMSQAAEG